jgi:branched-chain amino acid transport system substrate-binding protein
MKVHHVSKFALALAVLGATVGAAAAQPELKLGVMAILSGPGSAWGVAIEHAAELAAEDYNKDGGIDVGGTKYTIKLVTYDTKYRPDEALSAVNRMINQDGVKFILGPVGSSEAFAIQDITTRAKVLTMTNAWSPRVLGPQLPYQFRMSNTPNEFGPAQIAWINSYLKLKKVGGLYPNDELGQQGAKQIEAAYGAAGAQALSEMFERNRTDFVPLITRLVNEGVDAIELDGNSPVTTGLIVKQARGIGFKGPLVRTGGPAEDEILQVAGPEASEGIYLNSPVNPDDPAVKAFNDRYVATFKTKMNGFAPTFYDGARIVLEGIRKAGSVDDVDAVAKAIEGMKDFPGLQGKLSWTGAKDYGADRQIDSPFYVVQIQNGQSRPVASCSRAACETIKK